MTPNSIVSSYLYKRDHAPETFLQSSSLSECNVRHTRRSHVDKSDLNGPLVATRRLTSKTKTWEHRPSYVPLVTQTNKSTQHPSSNMADQRPQGLLKLQVHHWKQDNISDEEFAKWYTEEFIPRSVKILRNYGVEQYKLVSFSFGYTYVLVI